MTVRKLALGLVVCAVAQAQTRLDLRSQTKNIDFSEAVSTRPFRVSSSLPATCATGEMLFHTGAPAGNNVYGCIAKDTWVVMSAGSGSSSGAEVIAAGAVSAGPGIAITGSKVLVDTSTVPMYFTGEGPPLVPCEPGRDYYVDTAGAKLYFCSALNVWSAAGSGQASSIDASSITTGTMAAARLGSGTADSTTVLHGDSVFRPLPQVQPTGVAARTIEYPAAKCFSGAAATPLNLPASGAPSAACVTGQNGSYGVLQFADGTTAVSAGDRFLLTGLSVSVDIWWRTSAASASLHAVWQLAVACVDADGDGDPVWGAAQTVISAAQATANRWRKASFTGVTAAGCGTGKFLVWRLLRDPAHPSDDLAATAELISTVWTVQ